MTIFERGIYAPRGLAAIARRLTLLRRGDTLELMQKGRLKVLYPFISIPSRLLQWSSSCDS